MRGSPRSSRRSCTGSLPAAWAISSRNDWNTNASPLLPGARRGPVGTPNGMMFVSSRRFGTKRAGNSVSLRPAPLANVSPSPKVTKRFFQATIFPARLQEVEAGGPVEVVVHVVFARPDQLRSEERRVGKEGR